MPMATAVNELQSFSRSAACITGFPRTTFHNHFYNILGLFRMLWFAIQRTSQITGTQRDDCLACFYGWITLRTAQRSSENKRPESSGSLPLFFSSEHRLFTPQHCLQFIPEFHKSLSFFRIKPFVLQFCNNTQARDCTLNCIHGMQAYRLLPK